MSNRVSSEKKINIRLILVQVQVKTQALIVMSFYFISNKVVNKSSSPWNMSKESVAESFKLENLKLRINLV